MRWAPSWRSPARRRRKWSTNRKAAFRLDPTALNFRRDRQLGRREQRRPLHRRTQLQPFLSRVYQTDPSGTPTGVELDGSETPAFFFGFVNFATFNVASGPAVDGSAGANAGRIYVPDVFNGVVDLFDEAGEYVCQITGAATPSASECAGATGSETPSGGIEPLSVAVDPASGKVAVGDGSGVVYEFNEAGEYAGEIADPHIFSPFSLAFDSAGNLYLVNGNLLLAFEGSAVKFDSTGSFEYELAPERIGVGVDLGNDHVYLGGSPAGARNRRARPGGQPGQHVRRRRGVDGRRQPDDRAKSTWPPSGEGEIWSGDIFVPNVTTGAATEVEEETATLNGEVDPEVAAGGSDVESCQFEYGETEAYGQTAPCSPATPYSAPTAVSAGLTGLAPSTTYHYRLVAENEEGKEGQGEDRTFTTFGPPAISGELAIARTRGATVKAQIDPFGYETTCEVQYVDDASFQASGYAGAASVPCAGGAAGRVRRADGDGDAERARDRNHLPLPLRRPQRGDQPGRNDGRRRPAVRDLRDRIVLDRDPRRRRRTVLPRPAATPTR